MTRSALRVFVGLAFALCAACLGCSAKSVAVAYPHSRMETLAQDSDEHYHSTLTTLEQDRRGLAEDLDLVFMTDRPTRLSKWHGR